MCIFFTVFLPLQGERVRSRDVQAVHLQLPRHFLRRLSLELPQEVSLFSFSLFVIFVFLSEKINTFRIIWLIYE